MVGDIIGYCKHPLKGFPVGFHPSGKTKYKIVSYLTDHVEYNSSTGLWNPVYTSHRSAKADKIETDFVEIPCGKCIGCRLQRSREWANKLMLEYDTATRQNFYCAWFVTFTYNDKYVPRSYYGNNVTGEAEESLTLKKHHMQLYFKRLRKANPDARIRFFCCGEYGTNTFRPHYHAIIFGLELNDLVLWSKNKLGDNLYNSETLAKHWSNGDRSSPNYREPYGHVVVAECTWETCAYVARYVTKKLDGEDKAFYETFNLEPQFQLHSNKPGIGREWYDQHPDVFDYEYIVLETKKRGIKFRPPKYYERLYEIDDPDGYTELKEKRRFFAEEAQKFKMRQTELSYLEVLENEERSLENKVKQLRRCLEDA